MVDSAFNRFRDQGRVLKITGILLLLLGTAVGFLGPLEMYCFYLFAAGGRFHYEGFGYGSFMFGNIASQIIGYYLIAAVLMILGYGHITRQRWIRKVTIALSWMWLVIGVPMIVIVFFILAATKELSLLVALGTLVFLFSSYFVLPVLLIRYYKGNNILKTVENTSSRPSWVEGLPVPILMQSLLYCFLFVMFHILILFRGIFPLFGTFLSGLSGIISIDIGLAVIAVLTWGTLRRRIWAWWSSVILLGIFSISTIITFTAHSYAEMLAVLAFPPAELQFLQGIPAQGYHFAVLAGIPLIVSWLIAVLSRRYYGSMMDISEASKEASA